MNCPKCGTQILKEGAKFCPKCGTPLQAAPQVQICPECGKPVKPGAKFCGSCGASLAAAAQPGEKGLIRDAWNAVTHPGAFAERGMRGVNQAVRREERERVEQTARNLGMEVVRPSRGNNQDASAAPAEPRERRLRVDTTSIEGVEVVQGRAIWNIQKGQIARLVREAEFAATEGLKGVIVQQGCTAMVFIDGQLMSLMTAGVYTFPAKTQAEIQLEQREKEVKKERIELEKEEKRIKDEQRKKDEENARTFRSRGVFGEIAAFGRGVMGFLFGHKKDETPEKHKERVEKTEKKLRSIPSPKICRVYIVSNRVVNLLFGAGTNAQGSIEFAPMTIPTKLVDVEMGVSMQAQISNLQQFVNNYLADRSSYSVFDLLEEVMPSVKNILAQRLRNYNYDEKGLPADVVESLKLELIEMINQRLQGIEVVRIMDITDKSADFERFRSVERELFASEKELGFLQRTGEFRNRLEQEQNKQTVDHAANVESLRQALQNINKDKLLSEDEMEEFVLLLESQKRLREARTKEEEYEALIDLKKSRLVKDDDIAALQNTLAQGVISRENVTDIMRVQAEQKLDMARQIAEFELSDGRLEHDMAVELRKAQHEGNLLASQLDTQHLMDAYNDERNQFEWERAFDRMRAEDEYAWQKEERDRNAANQQAVFDAQMRHEDEDRQRGFARQDKFDDMTILERKAAVAQANMQAMKDAEYRELVERNRSAESIHSMDANVQINKDNVEATMSAEAIAAKNVGQMSAEGQKAFAESLGSGKENELLKQQKEENAALYQQMYANQQAQMAQNQEFMLRTAEMLKEGMVGVAGAQAASQIQRLEEQKAIKDEYRENMMHQQARIDHVQDVSLGSIGQVSTAAAGNINAYNGGAPEYMQPRSAAPARCPHCGADIDRDASFCDNCGNRI